MTENHTPVLERLIPGTGGSQELFRFANGYGASVVRGGMMAYGGLELAVIRYRSEDVLDFGLVYDTPITDDVLGYLAEDEISGLLDQIKALPNPAPVSA